MSTWRLARDRAGELLDETGLADSGLAEDGEELGAPLPRGALEGLAELGELAVAADQRRVEAPQEGRSPGEQLEQPPGQAALRAPSPSSSGSTVTALPTRRRVASPMQDLAGPARLLESDRASTALPVTSGSPDAGSPVSTSPESMPVQTGSPRRAKPRAARRPRAPRAARRPRVRRHAEDAHDPTVASRSTVAPCRSSTGATSSNDRSPSLWRSSGSRRWPAMPVTSTVTVLRAGGGAGPGSSSSSGGGSSGAGSNSGGRLLGRLDGDRAAPAGSSSSASWRRIAWCSSRRSPLGSMPSSSTSWRRVAW